MRHSIILLVCTAALSCTAVAQSGVTFHRVVNQWPNIEAYFTATCDSQPVFGLDAAQVLLTDNGRPVHDFTLQCANPAVPQPMSVCFVLDASGSMSGAGNAAAKMYFSAFASKLDGVNDEAAVVMFSTDPWLQLGFTRDTNLMKAAIDSLPASGATVIWDAIWTGLQETIAHATNDVRALVLLTDGCDASSTHTPQDFIPLAQQHHIRIYTIGLGAVSAGQLELIPMLTGARYFQCHSTIQISDALDSIYTDIRGAYYECSAVYNAEVLGCPDGQTQMVNLQVTGFCSDTAQATKSYRAPTDWDGAVRPVFSFDTLSAAGRDTIAIALRVRSDAAATVPPFELRFAFDTTQLALLGMDAGGGAFAFSPPAFSVQGGDAVLRTDSALSLPGEILIAAFRFVRQPGGASPAVIRIDTVDGAPQCFRTEVEPGFVTHEDPCPLYVHGDTIICIGETVLLSAPEGLTEYRWQDGTAGRFYRTTSAGEYAYTARTPSGAAVQSEPVRLANTPYSAVRIVNVSGDTAYVCAGDNFVLEAAPGYMEYYWSELPGSRFLNPYLNKLYRVTAIDSCGCSSSSAPVYYYEPSLHDVRPRITVYPTTLYSSPADSYQWLLNDQPIPGATEWKYSPVQTGTYKVRITYHGGLCTVESNAVFFQPVGVHAISETAFTVDIYPEPNRGEVALGITLDAAGPLRLVITDLLGRVVYEHTSDALPGTLTLTPDVSRLPDGMYLVRATAGARQAVRRMTVTR